MTDVVAVVAILFNPDRTHAFLGRRPKRSSGTGKRVENRPANRANKPNKIPKQIDRLNGGVPWHLARNAFFYGCAGAVPLTHETGSTNPTSSDAFFGRRFRAVEESRG
jgi:hypothetical protein